MEDMFPIEQKYKKAKVEFQLSRHVGNISGLLYKYVVAVKKTMICGGEQTLLCDKSGGNIRIQIQRKERGIKERTSDRPDKLLSGELEDLGLNMRHIISGIKDIGRV